MEDGDWIELFLRGLLSLVGCRMVKRRSQFDFFSCSRVDTGARGSRYVWPGKRRIATLVIIKARAYLLLVSVSWWLLVVLSCAETQCRFAIWPGFKDQQGWLGYCAWKASLNKRAVQCFSFSERIIWLARVVWPETMDDVLCQRALFGFSRELCRADCLGP